MNATEFRAKSLLELKDELKSLLRESFNLRMQHGSGQLAQPHQIKINRRNIARVKTVLKEKAGSES